MACYIIACDLNRPGEDYVELIQTIERLASRARECVRGTWLVLTDKTATELRDELRPYVGENDRLFVAQIGGEVAWRGPDHRMSMGLTGLLRPAA